MKQIDQYIKSPEFAQDAEATRQMATFSARIQEIIQDIYNSPNGIEVVASAPVLKQLDELGDGKGGIISEIKILDSATATSRKIYYRFKGNLRTIDVSSGDVTAAANIDANAVVIGDDGAKGVKKSTATISDNGEFVNSSQPSFLVSNGSTTQSNISSGDTIDFGTEIIDQGNDFASNIYTAPVAGIHPLGCSIQLTSVDADYTSINITIVTSNRTYIAWMIAPNDIISSDELFMVTALVWADMDASDTAVIKVNFVGGVDQVDITPVSYFFGGLVH